MTKDLNTTLKTPPIPPHREGLAADIITAAKETTPAFSWQRFWHDLRQPQWVMTAAALLLVGVLLGYQLHDITGNSGRGNSAATTANIVTADDLLPEEIYTMEAFEEEVWG